MSHLRDNKARFRILALFPGTIGYLDNYVAATTILLQTLCDDYGCEVTAIAPEAFWRVPGRLYPRVSEHGALKIFRKGGNPQHILPEDHQYFLDVLQGETFDIFWDFNDTSPTFRRKIIQKFDTPVLLTVERAGERLKRARWHQTIKEVQGVVTWLRDDIPRLEEIGAGLAPARHITFGLHIMGGLDDYAAKPRNPRQGCTVGSLAADGTHWKRSWELEQAIPLLLEQTPLETFVICGRTLDAEADAMVKRLLQKYPTKVQYVHFPADKIASVSLMAQSAFHYTPIGGGQIGSAPIEALATGTPLLSTALRLGEHMHESLHCTLDDLSYWVNRLFDEPFLWQTLSKKGKHLYEKEFTVHAMAEKYHEFSLSIIKETHQNA